MASAGHRVDGDVVSIVNRHGQRVRCPDPTSMTSPDGRAFVMCCAMRSVTCSLVLFSDGSASRTGSSAPQGRTATCPLSRYEIAFPIPGCTILDLGAARDHHLVADLPSFAAALRPCARRRSAQTQRSSEFYAARLWLGHRCLIVVSCDTHHDGHQVVSANRQRSAAVTTSTPATPQPRSHSHGLVSTHTAGFYVPHRRASSARPLDTPPPHCYDLSPYRERAAQPPPITASDSPVNPARISSRSPASTSRAAVSVVSSRTCLSSTPPPPPQQPHLSPTPPTPTLLPNSPP